MVHALHGIWQVLRADGTLVDLRPLSGPCPLEGVRSDAVVRLGEIDASGMAADDAAADRAMQEAVDAGWFVTDRRTEFDFAFYWDSIQEMASFLDESKRMSVLPSYADLEKGYRDLGGEELGPVRLRCRRRTMLAVYRKARSRVTASAMSGAKP